jgi:hypothetical protein
VSCLEVARMTDSNRCQHRLVEADDGVPFLFGLLLSLLLSLGLWMAAWEIGRLLRG